MIRDYSTRLRAAACAAFAASLLLAAGTATASELAQAIDRLVAQGLEDPQGANAGLNALQAATPATPDNTRALLVGFGLVAADQHLPQETAAAASALAALAATAGPIAEADAHLVKADLEFEGMQEENGNAEARAAVAGYSPYCEARDAAPAAQCDRFNWFYALLYAGYGAHGERNTAAAAIYVHMALDAALQAGNRVLETKATAILAMLAQGDNDTELAQRLIDRAQDLAKLEGDPALDAYVASFMGDVLGEREQYEASRAAYEQAIAISRAAGLHRREAQGELSLSSAELGLDHPTAALAALDRAEVFLARHNEPGMERQRLHDQTIALLALGRTTEAKVGLREVLARYDNETGPNARIGVLRDLGPALARSGDRAGALELFTREQQLLEAKSDGRYERDMQDVQKLIKDERDKLQSRRVAEWGGAAAACILLAGVIAFIARRQAERNRLLASRNDALLLQVEHDPLTGLANRAHLQARVAEKAGDLFEGALFLIDVDHFKDINDTYGHPMGDECLKIVAARLSSKIRQVDTIARVGGEEFAAIVGGLHIAEDAQKVAQSLLSVFDEPVWLGDIDVSVTVSIGIAIYPDDATEAGALTRRSDEALYAAKRGGRNQAVTWASMAEGVGMVKELGAA